MVETGKFPREHQVLGSSLSRRSESKNDHPEKRCSVVGPCPKAECTDAEPSVSQHYIFFVPTTFSEVV